MENKLEIKLSKILFRAYIISIVLMLINGCVSHFSPLADSFTQMILIVFISVGYHSLANTLAHENYMGINKSNAFSGRFVIILFMVSILIGFFQYIPNFNVIDNTYFINNNQLTYEFGLIVHYIFVIYYTIIFMINWRRFKNCEK